jgi:hypothetical protein
MAMQNRIDMGGIGVLQGGASLFNQGAGAIAAFGSRAASQLGGAALGVLDRAAPGMARDDVRAKFGQEILDENKRFGRQRAAEDEERQYRPMGGATDVSQIGQSIQAALLQPSAKDREEREHRRKLEQINEEMRDAIRRLDPANQVRGRQQAIAATITKGP